VRAPRDPADGDGDRGEDGDREAAPVRRRGDAGGEDEREHELDSRVGLRELADHGASDEDERHEQAEEDLEPALGGEAEGPPGAGGVVHGQVGHRRGRSWGLGQSRASCPTVVGFCVGPAWQVEGLFAALVPEQNCPLAAGLPQVAFSTRRVGRFKRTCGVLPRGRLDKPEDLDPVVGRCQRLVNVVVVRIQHLTTYLMVRYRHPR
jgi:hypothetical protein